MPERDLSEIRLAETRLRASRDLADARVRPAEGRLFAGGVGGGGGSIWAEITGGDQSGGYEWKEKEPVAGGSWQDKDGGRTHTDDGKAYLARNIIAAAACEGCVVRLFRVLTTAGTGEWRFEPPLPTPSTAYKVLAVDSDGDYWQEDDVRSPPAT